MSKLTDLFDNKLDQDERRLTRDQQQTSQTYRIIHILKDKKKNKTVGSK